MQRRYRLRHRERGKIDHLAGNMHLRRTAGLRPRSVQNDESTLPNQAGVIDGFAKPNDIDGAPQLKQTGGQLKDFRPFFIAQVRV